MRIASGNMAGRFPSPDRCARAWLFGLLALPSVAAAQVPTTQPARADEPAPTAGEPAAHADPPPAWRGLAFDDLSFDVGLDAEWHRRRTDSRTTSPYPAHYRQRDSRRALEESVGATATGSLFDERVLHFDLSGRWGVSQERYHETRPGRDLTSSPDGDLLEYDARATLFPAGKLSGTAFASQQEDRVPRAFLPSLDRSRERYGAELVYSDRVLPMRASFERTRESLSSPGFGSQDDEQRGDTRLNYEATFQPTENHAFRLDYEYDDRSERYSGTRTRFETTRNDLTLNHTLQFGADNRSRLETIARFQDESGDLARDQAEVAPRLRLQHSDALSTYYGGQYLRESFEGLDLELTRGDVGLTHQLGPSLTSTLGLYGLSQRADRGSDTREWGGTGNWAFTRDNGLGRFSATLGYAHTHARSDDGGRGGVVIGEAITLRDPLPTYLAHPDVHVLTVVLTDATRTRIYLPGRDYLAVRGGRYTAVSRLPIGRIADGETVLASYTYRTSGGFELGRDRIDTRVQQDFKGGLTPYYAGTLQWESIDRTRYLSFDPRDIQRHRVGVNYRRPRWSTGLEYEYNDDSIDPFQALHARADVTLINRVPHALDGRASFSHFRFRGADALNARQTSLLDLGTTYRLTLGPSLDAQAAAAYRYEDDSLAGVTRGVDVSGSLNWRIGQFTALLEVEYDLLELDRSRDRAFGAWIKLRRTFPVTRRAR